MQTFESNEWKFSYEGDVEDIIISKKRNESEEAKLFHKIERSLKLKQI